MFNKKFFRVLILIGILVLILAACGGDEETEQVFITAPPPEATEPPVAEEPSEAPATEAPATEAPTEEPATEAPATEAPATEAPATEAPPAEEGEVRIEVSMAKTAVCNTAAGANSPAYGTVYADTTVTMLGRGVGAGWIAIVSPTDPSEVCWLRETDVVYDGEFSELPIYGRTEGIDPDEEGEPIILPDGVESQIIADVSCLSGPGSGYNNIRTLLVGETVIVHGKGIGSGWFVVALPDSGQDCWIPDTAVDFTGNLEDLTIFNAPPK